MSLIRSKNTKPERRLRYALLRGGFKGYKLHHQIQGKPDIAFPEFKIAIFVDGDFWHGRKWKLLKPKLKNDYWVSKITNNKKRDLKISKELRQVGWKVMRFWEYEIKNDLDSCINKIKNSMLN